MNADAAEFVPSTPLPPWLPPSYRSYLRGTGMSPSGDFLVFYVGRLKSYNNIKGFGFIECDQLAKTFDRDIFLHKKYVPGVWHIGQPLEFAISTNHRGEPQASEVRFLPVLPEPGEAEERAGADSTSSGRFLGTLKKNFWANTGFGFIQCPAGFRPTFRDIYFDQSLLPLSVRVDQLHAGVVLECSIRDGNKAWNMDWEPVKLVPNGSASSLIAGPRSFEPIVMEQLGRLWSQIKDDETLPVQVSALKLAARYQEREVEVKDGRPVDIAVDYMTFALSRMPVKAAEAVACMQDSDKMILVEACLRLLGHPYPSDRGDLLVTWLEAASAALGQESLTDFERRGQELSMMTGRAMACNSEYRDRIAEACERWAR